MLLAPAGSTANAQQVATSAITTPRISAASTSVTTVSATTTGRATHEIPIRRDTVVAADTEDVGELDERPPRVAYGIAGRSSSFRDGHLEYGAGVLLTYAPFRGVSLGLNPSYTMATDTSRARTSGQFLLSSLPLSLSLEHGFDGVLSPDVGMSLGFTVPLSAPRDTTVARAASYDANIGLGVSPMRGVRIGAELSRDLGSGTQAAFSRAATNSAGIDLGVDAGSRLSLVGSFSGDLGTSAAGDTLSRTIGANISYRILGPLTLTVDGSHGIVGYTPRWSMSVGLGTAFAGIGSVGPASALARLRNSIKHVRGRGRSSTVSGKKGTKA